MITERQKELLEFLKNNDDKYLSQYQISRQLPWLYFYEGEQEDFHNSKARHRITADIRDINADNSIGAIVLSNGRGIKIATKEEFERGMKSEFSAIFRRLKRAYAKARKGEKCGQFEFDGNLNIGEYKIFKDVFERNNDNERKEEQRGNNDV
jgi:hypothetical protein